jgi:hypothetical protein
MRRLFRWLRSLDPHEELAYGWIFSWSLMMLTFFGVMLYAKLSA